MGNVANDLPPASPDLPAPRDEPRPMRSMPGLTVRRALEVPALTGVRVLAGATGLDRVVQRGNIMEVPDILPWVKPHELLLTTGYPLRNTPRGLPGLVTDLDARGLAALGVKLHRYLDGLPQGMLDEADRLGMPLLLVPDAVGFDDILNQVLTRVLNRQTAMLERTWAVHDVLVALVLEGGGLQELTAETARVLETPVLVASGDGRILAESGDTEALQAWRGTRSLGSGEHQAVVPIVAGRADHGHLVALSRGRDLDDGDVNVLERAATVAALVVTKQLAVGAVEGKYRGDFLRDMLAARAGRVERVVAHCDSLGWDVDRALVVVVAELDPQPGPQLDQHPRSSQERFSAAWQTVVERLDPRAAVVGFTQEVVVLLGVPADGDAESVVSEVHREVVGDGRGVRRFSTGVSRVVTDLQRLPEAYEQARDAVHVGRRMNGEGSVAHFDALGSFRLLSQIPDAEELRDFVRETLHGIAPEAHVGDDAMSADDRADLRRTLQVLLDTNLNVAQAARLLHFHYNTLRYRIGKLERIVGPFTTDPELRLDLALALKVLQMRGLPT